MEGNNSIELKKKRVRSRGYWYLWGKGSREEQVTELIREVNYIKISEHLAKFLVYSKHSISYLIYFYIFWI